MVGSTSEVPGRIVVEAEEGKILERIADCTAVAGMIGMGDSQVLDKMNSNLEVSH
jgi:hypothetical protein